MDRILFDTGKNKKSLESQDYHKSLRKVNRATLSSYSSMGLLDLKDDINRIYEERKDAEYQNLIDNRKKYIGKCYKMYDHDFDLKMYEYYRVISNIGFNIDHIPSLSFYEHPYYHFEYKRASPQFGKYDFNDGNIFIDDMYIAKEGLSPQYEEITLDEYNEAMNKFIQELQKPIAWKTRYFNTID